MISKKKAGANLLLVIFAHRFAFGFIYKINKKKLQIILFSFFDFKTKIFLFSREL